MNNVTENLKTYSFKFLEWNKTNWMAGGKSRWKVIGIWFFIFIISSSMFQQEADNIPIEEQNKRVKELSQILAKTAVEKKEPDSGAVRKLEKLAKHGNSSAKFSLAAGYQDKFVFGLDEDHEKSLSLANSLLENDPAYFIQASQLIGAIYDHGGSGVSQDKGKAIEWYKKAYDHQAINKNEETSRKIAAAGLANIYRVGGDNAPCDTQQAIQWFRASGMSEQDINLSFAIWRNKGIKECAQK